MQSQREEKESYIHEKTDLQALLLGHYPEAAKYFWQGGSIVLLINPSNTGVFLYGLLPPTIPRFLGYTFYRWEEIIRATVAVGVVGAGGLGFLLVEQLSSFDYPGIFDTLTIFWQ